MAGQLSRHQWIPFSSWYIPTA